MSAGDLEVEERLLVVGSLLRERGERVRHFEDGGFAGTVAGDGDVDVAPRVGNGGAGVVDAPDRRERLLVRAGEFLLHFAARDDQLILRRPRLQLRLTLLCAADSPVEDGDVEVAGNEIAAMLADVG